ncbi:MAG: SAM-dependent methyltransferase [Flavobacteriales bacterium]|nr:SAM-dependent methyltransferase [Flavobacteriales bacterium]
MSTGTLYLIPVSLGETNNDKLFPNLNLRLLDELEYLVVENEKSARRFIRSTGNKRDFDGLELILLDKRTKQHEISRPIELLIQGKDVGIMSEAGCPGVADPGQILIAQAHQFNIKVVPLIGPSSILLGLMASGLNGQGFTFHGYIPIDKRERLHKLRDMDTAVAKTGHTQIFMETPYRNQHLFDDILKTCNGNHKLCVAVDITLETEQIKTLAVAEWKTQKINLHKRPCMFLLGN